MVIVMLGAPPTAIFGAPARDKCDRCECAAYDRQSSFQYNCDEEEWRRGNDSAERRDEWHTNRTFSTGVQSVEVRRP